MIAVIPAQRLDDSAEDRFHRRIPAQSPVGRLLSAAVAARLVDHVIVHTDDPQVTRIAEAAGAEVHAGRGAVGTGSASTRGVLTDVLSHAHQTDFAILRSTPRPATAIEIDGAIAMYRDGPFDIVVSVVPQTQLAWMETPRGVIAVNHDPGTRSRSRTGDPIFVENGAIYVSSSQVLRRTPDSRDGTVGLFRMRPSRGCNEIDDPDGVIGAKSSPLHRVRLVLTDVDGVLTDNGMYWSSDGSEAKRFSARDGKGFELLHQAGIRTVLITSENLALVRQRGAKLGCHRVVLGCTDKVAAADVIREDLGLTWPDVAFIGDDVHDLGLLDVAGVSAAPADAVESVLEAVDHVLMTRGGAGCFREFADRILAAAASAQC